MPSISIRSSARIAAENYKVNGIDSTQYNVYAGRYPKRYRSCRNRGRTPYDLIAANIVADVIIWMAPSFKKFLAKDGTLIVSGIIA